MKCTDQELSRLLCEHGQSHVLRFWDTLEPGEQASLAQQVRSLDLDLIDRLYRARAEVADRGELVDRISVPSAFRWGHGDERISAETARSVGQAALRAGTVGVVVVAGGQGTRLGFPHPKGKYPIGPVSQATLFQILIEKVRAVSARYEVSLPIYLMTSPATHEETASFMEQQQWYGLAPSDLRVFCQGVMPAVDANTGQVVLASRSAIALSPDGHGGMLAALDQNGILAEMRQRGIEFLFYVQIDNPLVPIADAEIIGYHLLSASDATSLVIRKRDAHEKVGNVVRVDGKLEVIEYSDLPNQLAELHNTDGSLKLWAGSIAVHVFSGAFLEYVASGQAELPFHYAHKQVPFVDAHGQVVEPSSANAIKFERFIFDLLPIARRAVIVEVDRQSVFAPVKNAPGAAHDSPDTVKQQMSDVYRSWLQAAGCPVADGAIVEISPLFANNATELKSKLTPGFEVTGDTYLYLS